MLDQGIILCRQFLGRKTKALRDFENLARPTGLGFGIFLRLCIVLLFLLLLLELLIILALEGSLLVFSLGNGFEESFQAGLLSDLQVLRQARRTVAHTVLVESLVLDQEINEAFDVRTIPFEVTVRVVCRMNVRVGEQVPCILVWPFFGDHELLLRVVLHKFEDLLNRFVLFDQVESSVGSHLRDGLQIVTAQKNAEVNEL